MRKGELGLSLLLWICSFALVGVFVPYTNGAIFYLLQTTAPSLVGETFRESVEIAGIVEPFTSKLFPMFVATLGFSVVGYRRELIRRYLWLTGPIAALTFGLNELYYRNVFAGSEFHLAFWKMATFSPAQIGPVLLHVVTGTIIIWSAFAYTDYRYLVGSAGVFGAILIHYTWNTWWLYQGWFWRPFVDVTGFIAARFAEVSILSAFLLCLSSVSLLYFGHFAVAEE